MAASPKKSYPADTVILHQIGRGPYAPSMSPYPLKLETYLRMAEIPYQNEHGLEFSAKGKTPWISYAGEAIADSQLIIEHLNTELKKDLNGHLSKEQKAVARSLRKMTEDSLFWVLMLSRWIYNDDDYKFLKAATGWSASVCDHWNKLTRDQTHAQGSGRHTQEEAFAIGRGDLMALSDYLGAKPFMMGDEPCEEDCAIFGILAQMKWHEPDSPLQTMVKEDFVNLSDYCDRMKDRFWPDWEECNTDGGTKEAAK